MKNFCISLACLSIITLTAVLACGESAPQTEYLRIHIRADSNDADDQDVKYLVKDAVVEYLTPLVAEAESKEALQNTLKTHICGIEAAANAVLCEQGFGYTSKARVACEEFPTRVYGDLTLEAGYYDALIVNLGSGKGDNWWCVVYPPLCFTGGDNVVYRSKIAEIIQKWKDGR